METTESELTETINREQREVLDMIQEFYTQSLYMIYLRRKGLPKRQLIRRKRFGVFYYGPRKLEHRSPKRSILFGVSEKLLAQWQFINQLVECLCFNVPHNSSNNAQ